MRPSEEHLTDVESSQTVTVNCLCSVKPVVSQNNDITSRVLKTGSQDLHDLEI